MMFSVNRVNIKVVDNFFIYLVLEFHDFITTGRRVIDFTNTLSGFVCVLDSAAMLCLLTMITV
jgi:hypothetical protein